MRILVHDYGGHAFIACLSQELARRGHQVRHLYASRNITPKGALQVATELNRHLEIVPITTSRPLRKYAFVDRWFTEREYGRLLGVEVASFRPDVVLSAQAPLDSQARMIRATREIGAGFVFWLQDFIGLAAGELLGGKLPLLGKAIAWRFQLMEQAQMSGSDRIVTISDEFAVKLTTMGIEPKRIHVIPNWADIDHIPVLPKSNPWSREKGLDKAFVYMYTGTLALKHDPSLLLRLAQSEAIGEDGNVVVVSEGPGAEWLAGEQRKLSPGQLRIFSYQDHSRYAEVLASADVLVALLTESASTFSVPSKVLAYSCASRPILASMPLENPAARMISDNAMGIVCDAARPESFIKAADELRRRRDERRTMGRAGRDYALANFDIDMVTSQFEELLGEVVR